MPTAKRMIFDPRPVRPYLVALLAILIVFGAPADLLLALDLDPLTRRLATRFALMKESNLPTWTSSVLMLACAACGFAIFMLRRAKAASDAGGWAFLSAIFLCISIDEVAMLHEASGVILNWLIPAVEQLGGVFFYSWVVIGVPLMILFFWLLRYWFVAQRAQFQFWFATGVALFLTGALGIEMINSLMDYNTENNGIAYSILSSIEESFELVGLAVMFNSLLGQLRSMSARLELVADDAAASEER